MAKLHLKWQIALVTDDRRNIKGPLREYKIKDITIPFIYYIVSIAFLQICQ